jgi:Flp pilus assembly protein TadB
VFGWQGLVVAIGAAALRRMRRRRARSEPTSGLDTVALMVLSGVRAGLSLSEALSIAASLAGPPLGGELETVIRRARLHGLGPALAEASGRVAPLALLLARSTVTGTSPGPALVAFLDERRSVERARLLQEARTLPVRLAVPVALLILPGATAVALGPALAGQIDWLTGGLRP